MTTHEPVLPTHTVELGIGSSLDYETVALNVVHGPGGYLVASVREMREYLNRRHEERPGTDDEQLFIPPTQQARAIGGIVTPHIIPVEKPNKTEKNVYSFFGNQIVIDHIAHQIIYDGNVIVPAKKVFELIAFLGASPDRVYSRGQLLNAIWGYSHDETNRTVDVHVRRARQEIPPESIETVRGVGYKALGQAS